MEILNFLLFMALTTCYGSYAQETNSTKTIVKNITYLKGDVVKYHWLLSLTGRL